MWLEQRPPSGLWGGLWSLPQFERHGELNHWLEDNVVAARRPAPLPAFTHTFSHFKLLITPQPVSCERLTGVRENGLWYDVHQPPALGLAAPVKSLLSQLAPFDLDPAPGPAR